MRSKGALSKLVYSSLAFCLVASFTVMGCSPQSTPSPTATSKPTSTPTATVTAKPTPTSPATSTASGQAQYGGTLKIGFRFEGDSLGYPVKELLGYTITEAYPAVENLLRYDKAWGLVPWLATAYKTDAAAKTITFTLRKGVKFHDGTDFNAQAVKWNLDQFVAAKSPLVKLFASMDVVDDYTLRINLTTWDSTVGGNFALAPGAMVSPSAVTANGADWAVRHPVGTGPFKFVSWNAGVNISYQKFDGYWQQGKPYLDGVQFVFVGDDLTRELSLRAGETDTAVSLIATNLAKLKTDGFVVISDSSGAAGQGLVADSANPKSPFADVRVRQAAAYAIDNPTLVNSIFGVYGAVVTNQTTWPGYWAYNSSVVGYPYDPAKAKQLLTAAGYPNGFQTRMMSWNDTQRVSYATGVQSYLKAVGIDAAMDIITQVQGSDLQFSGKTWQGLAVARWGSDPDWITAASTVYNGNGSYVNMLLPDDYSQALKNGVAAVDFATKQKAAQDAMKLMIDKYTLIIPEFAMLDTMTTWSNVHNTGLYNTTIIVWTPEDAWLSKK